MKNTIEYLDRDRRVSKSFIEKLEDIGLRLQYGKFSYWDGQPYIVIGTTEIWLVEDYFEGNSHGIQYRYQHPVLKEIYQAMGEELKLKEEELRLKKLIFKQ